MMELEEQSGTFLKNYLIYIPEFLKINDENLNVTLRKKVFHTLPRKYEIEHDNWV